MGHAVDRCSQVWMHLVQKGWPAQPGSPQALPRKRSGTLLHVWLETQRLYALGAYALELVQLGWETPMR